MLFQTQGRIELALRISGAAIAGFISTEAIYYIAMFGFYSIERVNIYS